jgi:hypothetical protein
VEKYISGKYEKEPDTFYSEAYSENGGGYKTGGIYSGCVSAPIVRKIVRKKNKRIESIKISELTGKLTRQLDVHDPSPFAFRHARHARPASRSMTSTAFSKHQKANHAEPTAKPITKSMTKNVHKKCIQLLPSA